MGKNIEYSALKIEAYNPLTYAEPAYIFDIDGTLASRGDRGIHEYEKVGGDNVNTSVLAVMYQLKVMGNEIILLSGRPESCRAETELWLEDAVRTVAPYTPVLQEIIPGHGDFDNGTFAQVRGPWWDLYMREPGDYRPDFQVKYEIFDEKIRYDYNVVGVFDDRDQCVRLWRDLGLQTYQVAYGDF